MRITSNETMSSFMDCAGYPGRIQRITAPFCSLLCFRRTTRAAWVLSGWRCTYLGWGWCVEASLPPRGPGTQRGGWAEPAGAVGEGALLSSESVRAQPVSSGSLRGGHAGRRHPPSYSFPDARRRHIGTGFSGTARFHRRNRVSQVEASASAHPGWGTGWVS